MSNDVFSATHLRGDILAVARLMSAYLFLVAAITACPGAWSDKAREMQVETTLTAQDEIIDDPKIARRLAEDVAP